MKCLPIVVETCHPELTPLPGFSPLNASERKEASIDCMKDQLLVNERVG